MYGWKGQYRTFLVQLPFNEKVSFIPFLKGAPLGLLE